MPSFENCISYLITSTYILLPCICTIYIGGKTYEAPKAKHSTKIKTRERKQVSTLKPLQTRNLLRKSKGGVEKREKIKDINGVEKMLFGLVTGAFWFINFDCLSCLAMAQGSNAAILHHHWY